MAAVVVRFRRLRATAVPPRYMTAGSAGLDLAAAIETPMRIPPGGRAAVPTGLAVEIPPGHEGQVRPRSGLARRHGVTLVNAPGTIDADFRGELEVLLVNLGEAEFVVERGLRVAQLVVAPVVRVEVVEAESLEETERGGGGFGSTG